MDILYLIIIFILYIIFIDFFKIIIIIIIIIGIILFIIYLKKIYIGYPNINYQKDDKKNVLPSESIYDYKVSKEYEKMFLQPSIDIGFQEYDKGIVDIPPMYQESQKIIDNKIANININPKVTPQVTPQVTQILPTITSVPSIELIDTYDNLYNSSIINNLFKRLFSLLI